MEFFETTLEAADVGVKGNIGGHVWPISSTNGLSEYAGKSVEIGIRPQDISVVTDPTAGIPARHKIDEPLGDRTNSFFETDDGRITVVTPPDFSGDEREYGLVLDTDQAKVFDTKSGVRVG
jgi:multiple sugar transport system ATP-binding protein